MFSYPDAARHLGIQSHLLSPSDLAQGASIDTRTLSPGDLFVAIRGHNRDGHDFLEEAFRQGASGALIDRGVFKAREAEFQKSAGSFRNLLPVPDTASALMELALWHRKSWKVPVIGITGSVGKTVTKDFCHYLLSQKWSGIANRGNFNNHLGLPLTMLRMDRSDRFCVAELGANHPGEIKNLSSILQPTVGVITKIAPVHLEGFGSLEAIYNAKLELFQSLPEGAFAFLPDDDEPLFEKAKKLPVQLIRVGVTEKAEFRITRLEASDGWIRFEINGQRKFSFRQLAPFYASNAAMALAVAEKLGLNLSEWSERWDDLTLAEGRFQEFKVGNIRVIHDGYNASPLAFEKALEAYHRMPVQGKKVLVISDMMELGSEEGLWHQKLGSQIAQYPWDHVAAYGMRVKASIEALKKKKPKAPAEHYAGADQVSEFLIHFLKPGDCVLLKGSRSMKIEQILKNLQRSLDGSQEKPVKSRLMHS